MMPNVSNIKYSNYSIHGWSVYVCLYISSHTSFWQGKSNWRSVWHTHRAPNDSPRSPVRLVSSPRRCFRCDRGAPESSAASATGDQDQRGADGVEDMMDMVQSSAFMTWESRVVHCRYCPYTPKLSKLNATSHKQMDTDKRTTAGYCWFHYFSRFRTRPVVGGTHLRSVCPSTLRWSSSNYIIVSASPLKA